MENASLYIAYHAQAPQFDSPSLIPLHVGRAQVSTALPNMKGDDTGDNISTKNSQYCELTALYWAWKNDTDSTHIGLMHYRRVLDLAGHHTAPQTEVFPNRFEIESWSSESETWLNTACADWDLIIPKSHQMGRTVASNYVNKHAPADWQLTRNIIVASYPEYLESFDTVAADHEIYLANMMIMRRALLERYCPWLFDILHQLESTDIDRSTYDPRQNRYLGFIAERLFTVYIHHLRKTQPDLKVREVNIINLSKAMVFPYTEDTQLNAPDQMNIAFSADGNYLPHTAAMLQSLLSRADQTRQINLFFLHSDIAAPRREMLQEVVDIHPKTTLHEINTGAAFGDSYRSPSRAPSNATYNRFLLFHLLPKLDRLLYVDVDMIFRGDVCEIFDTPMGDARLGAVPDYIMTRVLTGPTPTSDPDIPDLYTYYSRDLGLSDDQIGRYFNAGILLFNFANMDVTKTGHDLLEMAENRRFLFRDQDILNVYFKDETLRLNDRYNVFNTIKAGYNRVPVAQHAAAMAARSDPFVIHYAAGDYKPWKKSVPMGQYYWEALFQTPFFADVAISRQGGGKQTMHLNRPAGGLTNTGKILANRIPALRPILLRIYRILQRIRN